MGKIRIYKKTTVTKKYRKSKQKTKQKKKRK
mgnify:CR=1 FL=1